MEDKSCLSVRGKEKGSCLDLGRSKFLELMDLWLKETNDGEKLKVEEGKICPYQSWIMANTAGCGKDMVGGLAYCPVCGEAVCPDCDNHNVNQLSRVTGYIGSVDGWNAGKKQELADRTRTVNFGMG